MEPVNYTLNWISEILDEVLDNYSDVCHCEQCKNDMIAYAANKIKPSYVVNKHGHVYAKSKMLDQQDRTEILAEVINAINKISKNPHHLE